MKGLLSRVLCFSNRGLLGTFSKAFLKSRNTAQISFPLLKHLYHFSTALTRTPVVDLPLRKLHWYLDNKGLAITQSVIHGWTCLSISLLMIGKREIGLNCMISCSYDIEYKSDPGALPFLRNTTRSQREIKEACNCGGHKACSLL